MKVYKKQAKTTTVTMTLLTITDHHSSTLNNEIYWTISIPIKKNAST